MAELPKGASINEADLDKLAELELKRRRIKSTIKTAHLLASGKEETTGFSYVKTVLKVTKGETV